MTKDKTVLECVILKEGFIPFKKVYLLFLLSEHFVCVCFKKKPSIDIV